MSAKQNRVVHIYKSPWYNQRGTADGTVDDWGRVLVQLHSTGDTVAVYECDLETVHSTEPAASNWQAGIQADPTTGERVISAVVPRPAGEREALQGAIRECWRTEQQEWDSQADVRHRHEIAPDRFSKMDRMAQNRSLGWPEYHRAFRAPRPGEMAQLVEGAEVPTAEIQLHPMGSERYLVSLARPVEELRPRLRAMRAEMAARPEEFGTRCFDIDLWADSAPGCLLPLAREVEEGLAHWIMWVGTQGRQSQDFHRAHSIDGFHFRSRRTLAVFATWARDPWFCDVRSRDLTD